MQLNMFKKQFEQLLHIQRIPITNFIVIIAGNKEKTLAYN